MSDLGVAEINRAQTVSRVPRSSSGARFATSPAECWPIMRRKRAQIPEVKLVGKSRLTCMLAAALVVAMAMPGVVFAGTQDSCFAVDTTKVRLWENAKGDTSDGDDSYWVCSADNDLSNNSHTLPGSCNVPPIGSATWNNCVSSVTVFVPSGQILCLYQNAGLSSLMISYTGPISSLRTNVASDVLSSFAFFPASEGCI